MGKGLTTSTISGSSTGTAIDGLTITGSVTILGGDSTPGVDTFALSASSNVSASAFYGDGSNLSNVTGDARSVAGDTDNAVISWVTSDNTFAAEAGLTFASDTLSFTADSSVLRMGVGNDITLTHDGTTGATLAATPVSINSVGNLTLSSSTDLIFVADGADIVLKDQGVAVAGIQLSGTAYPAGTLQFSSSIADKDVVFMGNDAGTPVYALVLDMSDGGSAMLSNDAWLVSDSSVLKFGQGSDVTFTHDGGTGMDIASAGNLDIDCTAGSVTLGASLADGQTLKLGKNGAVETIIAPHGTAGSEIYSVINTAGDTDGSDAAGAVLLSSVAGGIGLAWHDAKDLWAEGGRFVVTANEDAADCILLHADAGTSQTIQVVNDAGTTDGSDDAGAIELSAAAGGIGLAWADDKDLWAEGGRTVITANENAADCILLHGDAGANQTIRVLNDAGTGTAAIALTSTAGGITLTVNSSKLVTISGGDLVPGANGTLDLGGSSARWANIYTSDMNFANDRGDWTLIEENDFISFRNNHTGRRFKMLMDDITDTGDYGPDIDGNM